MINYRITNIEKGRFTKVTLNTLHSYKPGQVVTFKIPEELDIQELNQRNAIISEVFQDKISLDLDSSQYSDFIPPKFYHLNPPVVLVAFKTEEPKIKQPSRRPLDAREVSFWNY